MKRIKSFFKEYRAEIIAILIALLGIFLLVEQLHIRETIFNSLSWIYETARQMVIQAKQMLEDYLLKLTVSDFIGYILVTGTLIFVLWRVRYRFIRSKYWRITACPRCGGSVVRIHRKPSQRFFSKLLGLHASAYRCTNSECNWSGLRESHRHLRTGHSEVENGGNN